MNILLNSVIGFLAVFLAGQSKSYKIGYELGILFGRFGLYFLAIIAVSVILLLLRRRRKY